MGILALSFSLVLKLIQYHIRYFLHDIFFVFYILDLMAVQLSEAIGRLKAHATSTMFKKSSTALSL